MLEPKSKAKKEISPTIWVPLAVALIGIIGGIVVPIVVGYFTKPPVVPTPTFSCIQADDILVKFHLSRNDGTTFILSPLETISLEPGLTLYFEVETLPVVPDKVLPPLECAWTNTGIATDGSLRHNTGCRVDYQSGLKDITDTVTVQLSQAACPALSPVPFFITPKQ